MSYEHQVSNAIRKVEDFGISGIKKLEDLGDRLKSRILVNNDVKEKRKINVRTGYLLKIKKYYRTFLAKHYMKKEAKLLEEKERYTAESDFNFVHGEELQQIRDKKYDNVSMMQEHAEKLHEIEQIKNERAMEKSQEEYEKAMQPIEPIKLDNSETTNNVIKEQDTVPQVGTPVVPEEPVAKVEPEENVTPVQPEQASEPKPEEPEVNPEVQALLAHNVQEIVSGVDEKKETVENPNQNGSEDVDALLKQFEQHGSLFTVNWENAVKQMAQSVKDYTASIQKTSVEALANKQIELNKSRKENRGLSNENEALRTVVSQKSAEVTNLNATNQAKDEQIKQLTSLNNEKDNKISEVTALYNEQKSQNESKDAEIVKLRQEMGIMSQQFKNMSAMFNNFQNMMNNTMQSQEVPVQTEETPVQKALS